MSSEKLSDRDFQYVPRDSANKIVDAFVVDKGKRATNPFGTMVLTSTNNYQTQFKQTGSESVVGINLTLAASKTILIQVAVAMGVLTAESSDVEKPTSVVVTSEGGATAIQLSATKPVSLQLHAEVLPEGSIEGVVWSVNSSPAGVSISQDGLITFATTVTPATITAKATAKIDPTKSGTFAIVVSAAS